MNWTEHKTTNPILRKYVEGFLFRSGPLNEGEYPPFMRVLPRTGTSLFLDFRGVFSKDESWLKTGVNGYHKNYYYLARLSGTFIDQVIVNFSPAGLARFTSIGMNELTEKLVDGELVFGPAFRRVFQSMGDSDSVADRIRILEAFFLSRYREPDLTDRSLELILDEIGKEGKPVTGERMLSFTGMSLRQLERRFQRTAGASIRTLTQNLRFDSFKKTIKTSFRPRLSDLALDVGFYDQSQFIRKIKEMSGLTPGEFAGAFDPCEISDQNLLQSLTTRRFDTIPFR